MKIVYLVNSNGEKTQHGAYKKILHEKECFENLGHKVKLIVFHTSPIGFPTGGAEFLTMNSTDESAFKKILLGRKLNKIVLDKVKSETPDIIYFRDRGVVFNLFEKLSMIAPTFVEVQTNVIEEYKVTSTKRYLVEKHLKRKYYKNIKAFVCITKELYLNESQYNSKPGYILGNGILNEDLGFIEKSTVDGKIHLLFIVSPGLPWHGTDRLLRSLEKAPNKEKFLIHIVGEDGDRFKKYENVKFYGIVRDRAELDKIFSMCDIGIGTLALYKMNMKEAAPLKIRNYIGKGLPVILAYEDVDLSGSLDFVHNIPNDDSDIDFAQIEKFYNSTKELRKNGKIVEYAKENLLWSKKIKDLSDFIEKLIK